MRRTRKSKQALEGITERLFDVTVPHPAGSLLNAGITDPFDLTDWWSVMPLWSHSHYGLVMVLSDGEGFYRDEDGMQCGLSRSHFILTFPNRKQLYGPSRNQKWGEIYVGFEGQIFRAAHEQKILNSQQPVWELSSPNNWAQKLEEFLRADDPKSPHAQFHRAVRFLDFLLGMMAVSNPVGDDATGRDWFAEACHMIVEDLHHKPDWEEIAAAMGMSYHTFRLHFRRRAGMAPYQFRKKYRFEAAIKSLKEPHYSCKYIAAYFGFVSTDHFSNQFKKRFGMSPMEYRQKTLQHLANTPTTFTEAVMLWRALTDFNSTSALSPNKIRRFPPTAE